MRLGCDLLARSVDVVGVDGHDLLLLLLLLYSRYRS